MRSLMGLAGRHSLDSSPQTSRSGKPRPRSLLICSLWTNTDDRALASKEKGRAGCYRDGLTAGAGTFCLQGRPAGKGIPAGSRRVRAIRPNALRDGALYALVRSLPEPQPLGMALDHEPLPAGPSCRWTSRGGLALLPLDRPLRF